MVSPVSPCFLVPSGRGCRGYWNIQREVRLPWLPEVPWEGLPERKEIQRYRHRDRFPGCPDGIRESLRGLPDRDLLPIAAGSRADVYKRQDRSGD